MATFYNQATLSYNGKVASSNITSGEILEVISATKTAVSDQYTTTDEKVYVVSIVNTGTTSYNGITVTDDLGAYAIGGTGGDVFPLTYNEGSILYYVNGIQQAAPAVTSVSPLTVTGISVPAGGNAALVYSTNTNGFAPLGTGASITNTITVSGTDTPGAKAFDPIVASETIYYSEGIDLAISKSLSPAAVEENGTVTYTFTIQNFGSTPAEVADNVIFSDTFTPALNDITVEFNGTSWLQGTNYSYSPTTGVFTSLDGQITVPAAQFTQDETTGEWSTQPGVSTLVIRGNLA